MEIIPEDVNRALSEHVETIGAVPAGLPRRIGAENNGTGRLAEKC
ncbi:MAG TPA: hypothetical protein VGR90_06875 [Acidimicrobiales bacterium]|nr:hypothetical protein [Acidimicrobiales bacterium]